ncbi:MAG: GIY-YIG catalytic domain protein [Candidatus Roizmanbacteria bacterium GW2011_GWA2_35_19]|uniref:GIY-YIG catalytic domain protein n=2 Tax=Candidatus Roizmaniibacteriota TaxID=1752723 RepID=A0A0G0BVI4_9BACT|nr:MAG: GIY-YIG catalytic domain protein [Candidatus Roizmanbacteria bacterium GW2011_GWC2_35_12]KKP73293.1 MAG: GIY-YIG catalytic domain protein [Candidatus Roizmanbacteria bacterium GW2011_GWA2_35_19]
MYLVYAIWNKEHNKIYIGQSVNLIERLRLHKEKIFTNSYTSRFRGEWKLIYTEEYETRKEALVREKQLKSYRGREFVKKYIPL